MGRAWAVDLSPFGDEYANRFRSALKNLTIPFAEVDPCDMDVSLRKIARRFENPFLYGSIALMKARERVKEPTTVWLKWEELSYSRCAEKIAPYLLNYPYRAVLWSEIIANNDVLFEGADDAVFIRPDSHDKIFSGTRVPRAECEKWLAQQEYLYSVPPSTKCIVAPARSKIESEWRFIIAKDDVIDFSKYRIPSELIAKLPFGITFVKSASAHDLPAMELALKISEENPLPYPAYIVDVGCDGTDVKVLELGSVNCCDWYDCSIETVVGEIQKHL